MGMSIFARPQLAYGIVEVKDTQILVPADLVPLPKHRRRLGVSRQVIPGRRHVAGVEAISDAIRLPHMRSDIGQLPEAVAQRASRPDRRLQAGDGAVAGQVLVQLVQGLDDPLEAGQLVLRWLCAQIMPFTARTRFAQVRARMTDKQANPQRLASLYFLALKRNRFFAHRSIRRGEIDQVTVVTDHARRPAFFVPPERFEFGEPFLARFVAQRRRFPLPLVLGEHLNAVHVEPLSFVQSVDQPAGNGQM